jgi:hypothetical protein
VFRTLRTQKLDGCFVHATNPHARATKRFAWIRRPSRRPRLRGAPCTDSGW